METRWNFGGHAKSYAQNCVSDIEDNHNGYRTDCEESDQDEDFWQVHRVQAQYSADFYTTLETILTLHGHTRQWNEFTRIIEVISEKFGRDAASAILAELPEYFREGTSLRFGDEPHFHVLERSHLEYGPEEDPYDMAHLYDKEQESVDLMLAINKDALDPTPILKVTQKKARTQIPRDASSKCIVQIEDFGRESIDEMLRIDENALDPTPVLPITQQKLKIPVTRDEPNKYIVHAEDLNRKLIRDNDLIKPEILVIRNETVNAESIDISNPSNNGDKIIMKEDNGSNGGKNTRNLEIEILLRGTLSTKEWKMDKFFKVFEGSMEEKPSNRKVTVARRKVPVRIIRGRIVKIKRKRMSYIKNSSSIIQDQQRHMLAQKSCSLPMRHQCRNSITRQRPSRKPPWRFLRYVFHSQTSRKCNGNP